LATHTEVTILLEPDPDLTVSEALPRRVGHFDERNRGGRVDFKRNNWRCAIFRAFFEKWSFASITLDNPSYNRNIETKKQIQAPAL
jgi:hypothetical protein